MGIQYKEMMQLGCGYGHFSRKFLVSRVFKLSNNYKRKNKLEAALAGHNQFSYNDSMILINVFDIIHIKDVIVKLTMAGSYSSEAP